MLRDACVVLQKRRDFRFTQASAVKVFPQPQAGLPQPVQRVALFDIVRKRGNYDASHGFGQSDR